MARFLRRRRARRPPASLGLVNLLKGPLFKNQMSPPVFSSRERAHLPLVEKMSSRSRSITWTLWTYFQANSLQIMVSNRRYSASCRRRNKRRRSRPTSKTVKPVSSPDRPCILFRRISCDEMCELKQGSNSLEF